MAILSDSQQPIIISADYEEEKRMIIVLKEFKETRSLLIYDEQGSLIAEIVSPQGYIFVSLKNQDGNLMVVAQGENDMTRDCFGRNDWNFAINFENLYVEKNLLYNNIFGCIALFLSGKKPEFRNSLYALRRV